MTDVKQVYDKVAKGEFIPIANQGVGVALLQVAREKLKEGQAEWEGALRVAAKVGGWQGGQVLEEAVETGSSELRNLVLIWAEKAGESGLKAIRAALVLEESALVVRAFEILTRHAEPSATSRARQLLYDPRPEVRAAAATYLGQVAGVAVLSALQDLLPDPQSSEAARTAIGRIEGTIPRLEAEPWARP